MLPAIFVSLSDAGLLSLRIDTHGGRFVEGLDTQSSYAVLERNAPKALRDALTMNYGFFLALG